MRASEVMTSNVVSVRENSPIEYAARLLSRHRISGLPVVNEAGALVGLISEYDMLAKSGRTVTDIMARSVISVGPDTSVEEVSHLLTNQRIRRVPVVQDGKVIGIVSRSDLVRQIAMRWVCGVCGEIVLGNEAPDQCPRCHAAQDAFNYTAAPPGM